MPKLTSASPVLTGGPENRYDSVNITSTSEKPFNNIIFWFANLKLNGNNSIGGVSSGDFQIEFGTKTVNINVTDDNSAFVSIDVNSFTAKEFKDALESVKIVSTKSFMFPYPGVFVRITTNDNYYLNMLPTQMRVDNDGVSHNSKKYKEINTYFFTETAPFSSTLDVFLNFVVSAQRIKQHSSENKSAILIKDRYGSERVYDGGYKSEENFSNWVLAGTSFYVRMELGDYLIIGNLFKNISWSVYKANNVSDNRMAPVRRPTFDSENMNTNNIENQDTSGYYMVSSDVSLNSGGLPYYEDAVCKGGYSMLNFLENGAYLTKGVNDQTKTELTNGRFASEGYVNDKCVIPNYKSEHPGYMVGNTGEVALKYQYGSKINFTDVVPCNPRRLRAIEC